MINQLQAVLGLKYGVLRRRRNGKKEPIKLYWWHDHGNGIANFGDEITKDILLNIFGHKSVLTSQDRAELVGAGSILEIVSHRSSDNKIHVWGSGFMWAQEQQAGSLSNLSFHAVRGLYTKNRINSKYSDVALGDPGLLASIVYERSQHKTNKIGVVVHFIDNDEPIVQRIKDDKKFKIIDPLRHPEIVAHDITSCKFILSSSLHGLIFADSFNIPNVHVQFSNKVVGGTFKFKDYYSATGREYRLADSSKIFESLYLDSLRKSFQPVINIREIQRRLVRSFPRLR